MPIFSNRWTRIDLFDTQWRALDKGKTWLNSPNEKKLLFIIIIIFGSEKKESIRTVE